MIGIIGAMDVELALLRAQLQQPQTETVSGMDFTRGMLDGREVVLVRCGIGKVFAAMCAQTMILRYAPSCIINTGVAGTLTPELSVGDIALASTVVQYDMDTSPLGDPVGLVSGINMIHFPASEPAVSAADAVLRTLGLHHCVGTIASGDRFLSDHAKKEELYVSFGAIACEMEGGAIGQVCYVNHVPFLLLRAISDSADGSASVDYPAFVQSAAQHSAQAVQSLIGHL